MAAYLHSAFWAKTFLILAVAAEILRAWFQYESVQTMIGASVFQIGVNMGITKKIFQSPFRPNLEVFGDIVAKVHVPYSDRNVTLKINPNITEYQEDQSTDDAQIRQVTITTDTDETVSIQLDLDSNRSEAVTVAGRRYLVELANIGKENQQGQEFPFFEVDITEV